MKTQRADQLINIIGAISLLVYPILLMLAFAMHFKSLGDFFDFELVYRQNSAADFMATLSGPDKDRLFMFPHYLGYAAMPFMLATALVLGKLLYQKRPAHAFMGAGLSLLGVIYMAGVFATWLSFAAVGNVPTDIIEPATQVLKELTSMQGALMYSTILSVFSLLGMVILGVGLYNSNVTSKWSAVLIILGHLFIIVFMDLDNWMLIGSLLMLIGLYPVSSDLFRNRLSLTRQLQAPYHTPTKDFHSTALQKEG